MFYENADPGTPVYDAEGKWVGIVSLRHMPGSHLVVQMGRLFPKDIYVPAGAVAGVDGSSISLKLSRRELDTKTYARPPAAAPANPAATVSE